MKPATFIMTAGTIILLGISCWMKVNNIDLHGGYSRGAKMQSNTMTPGAVFFFAIIFAVMLIVLLDKERKDRKKQEKGEG